MPCPAMNPIRRFFLRSPVSVRVLPFVRLHDPQSRIRFTSSFDPLSILGMRWSRSRHRALLNIQAQPKHPTPCSATSEPPPPLAKIRAILQPDTILIQ